MELEQILSGYSIDDLEQLSSSKVMDIGHIRLPKEVLIEELSHIINTPSYVNKIINYRNPPNFQILDIIINSPDFKVPVKGFKENVIERSNKLIAFARETDWQKGGKNYSLYLKVIKAAWETDQQIDSSEFTILNVLRDELNISFKEHIVLQHHPDLINFWMKDNYYERERNYLISNGILLPFEQNYYVIAETIGKFIRKAWGMDLNTDQYVRMLSLLSNNDLSEILQSNALPISGTSQQKIQRIIENYISSRKALTFLSVDVLRNLARACGSQISGIKEDVIENLIDFFDDDEDLKSKDSEKIANEEIIPESKLLNENNFKEIFNLLSNDQLYNIASSLKKIKKSGSKDMRITNMWNSPYNERTLLDKLSNSELYNLCDKNGLKVSGPKDEKINRLIFAAHHIVSINKIETEQADKKENELESTTESADKNYFKETPDENPSTVISLHKDEYPYLDSNELLVLSWIKDLKSINEFELERLISRHNLQWFFPRTQLEKLNAKLLGNNKPILSIRNVGDNCIYEFAG